MRRALRLRQRSVSHGRAASRPWARPGACALSRLSAGDARPRGGAGAGDVQRALGGAAASARRHAAPAGPVRRNRLAILPEVPAFDEAGLPDTAFLGWNGVVAPAGFRRGDAERLAEVIRAAITTDPAARSGLDVAGNEMLGTSPAAFVAFQARDAARWTAVVARPGLRAAGRAAAIRTGCRAGSRWAAPCPPPPGCRARGAGRPRCGCGHPTPRSGHRRG